MMYIMVNFQAGKSTAKTAQAKSQLLFVAIPLRSLLIVLNAGHSLWLTFTLFYDYRRNHCMGKGALGLSPYA